MDFWDVTKLLFRRWYIAVPLLVLTAAVAISVGFLQKPDYELTAYLQLVPAPAHEGPKANLDPVNPWNQIGLDSLSGAAQLGTLDHTFLDSLKAQGLSADFTINIGAPPSGDTFEIIGTSKEQAQKTTDLVITRFAGYVQSLQTSYGVPSEQIIATKRLDHGDNISRPSGKVKRAVIAVVGSGIIVMCALCLFVDFMARRRRQPTRHPAVPRINGSSEGPVPPPRRPMSDLVSTSSGRAQVGRASVERTNGVASAPDETSILSLPDLDTDPSEDPR